MRRLLTIAFVLLMPVQLVYAEGTFTLEELKLILNQKPSLANYLFSTLDFDQGGYTANRIGSNVNKVLAGKRLGPYRILAAPKGANSAYTLEIIVYTESFFSGKNGAPASLETAASVNERFEYIEIREVSRGANSPPANSLQATSLSSRISAGCAILASLRSAFQRRNPQIVDVKIVDVRPTVFGEPKYLVVGWGVRADRKFQGNFEDELFGLFLIDSSLTQVETVIDFVPSPRWLDTEMRIAKLDAGIVVLEAKGETYRDTLLRRKYNWRKEAGTFHAAPNKRLQPTPR